MGVVHTVVTSEYISITLRLSTYDLLLHVEKENKIRIDTLFRSVSILILFSNLVLSS